jgi:hypothetical protein
MPAIPVNIGLKHDQRKSEQIGEDAESQEE